MSKDFDVKKAADDVTKRMRDAGISPMIGIGIALLAKDIVLPIADAVDKIGLSNQEVKFLMEIVNTSIIQGLERRKEPEDEKGADPAVELMKVMGIA